MKTTEKNKSAGFGGFLRVCVRGNPPTKAVRFQEVAKVGGFGGFLLGLIIIFINLSFSVLTHYYSYILTAAPKETRKTPQTPHAVTESISYGGGFRTTASRNPPGNPPT